MKNTRILNYIIMLIFIPMCILLGVVLFQDRKYNIISIIIAFAACIPNFYNFERGHASTKKMVLIAVMVALSVIGRCIFAVIPFFKPVTALVVITAIYFGAEAGFLTGALTALISNMFYGQGPWTPFQMFTWGCIGFIAGIPLMQKLLKRKLPLMIYAAVAGVLFSLLMDIWTTIALDGTFQWSRYGVLILSALPITCIYAVSNMVFLLVIRKPIGKKLERIKIKYGL